MDELIGSLDLLVFFCGPPIATLIVAVWALREGGFSRLSAALLALGLASLMGVAMWLQIFEFAADH
jgi:hypothetical protein